MQINWFTVIAQIINFFILVWLLKRYLYKPILNAIDERERKIAKQLNEAEAKKAEAKKEQAEFIARNQQFDQTKKERLEKVLTEIKAEKEKLIEEVRSDVSTLRAKLEKEYIETQENKEQEISRKTQQEVFAISRKTLNDLASVRLEDQVIQVFMERLTNLNEDEKRQFREAFNHAPKPVCVHSAFDLTEKQQILIKETVSNILSAEIQVQFSVTPDLISGIEITANGYKVAWNIAAYLTSIEKSLTETTSAKPENKTEKV
jgi:F-type H+-transporting ATPase subunit b